MDIPQPQAAAFTNPIVPPHSPSEHPSRPSPPLSGRDRFLHALGAQEVDHPPIWLMRQAGRALPEYRELKKKFTFVQLVQTPDLATEVTLQPIRRFGFDGAVIFSDILIAAEAMGQPYRFLETGGIKMDFAVRSTADVEKLQPEAIPERLTYLSTALQAVRGELAGRTALLGFAGSPWTLANYMVEGGSLSNLHHAKELFYCNRPVFDRLLSKITQAVTALLRLQIAAGADVLQIFDTLGELLAADAYEEASARWIRQILTGLPEGFPVLLYVRGAPVAVPLLTGSGLRGFSLDWRMDLAGLRRTLPGSLVLQGNLDPTLMLGRPETVTQAAQRMLDSMRGTRGYIVNLGHGLPAGSTLENIEALTQVVRASASPAS